MCISLLTPLNIKLSDAKIWAKNWQRENPKHAKAFVIPTLEILSCMKEMGIIKSDGDKYIITDAINNAGIRAYMAINPKNGTDQKNGYGEKLLIVGTMKDKNGDIIDIIEGRTAAAEGKEGEDLLSGLKGSGIYDFSTPCPTTCDRYSPLVKP